MIVFIRSDDSHSHNVDLRRVLSRRSCVELPRFQTQRICRILSGGGILAIRNPVVSEVSRHAYVFHISAISTGRA